MSAVKGFLHHQLLGTTAASECCLQGGVAAQAGIDFDQPMGSDQQADKGIVEFVDRRVLDRLLGNRPVTTFPQSLDECNLAIAVPVLPTFSADTTMELLDDPYITGQQDPRRCQWY